MITNVDLENRLDNLIFPIGKGRLTENGDLIEFELYETAFLIGTENFALTASHVIKNILEDIKKPNELNEHIVGIFKNSKNEKYSCCIAEQDSPIVDHHPIQDVAIIKLTIDKKIRPPFLVDRGFVIQAKNYYSLGYPEHLKFDNNFRPKNADGTPIPDEINVVTKGYIRRLVKYPLPKLKGNNFLELSEIGTSGYSGAPIVSETPIMLQVLKNNQLHKEVMCHRLLGIYIGEVETEFGLEGTKIYRGYASNIESFTDWRPPVLEGKNIFEAITVLIEG